MEFRVILDYITSSRPAWATGGNPVSKQAKAEAAMKVRDSERGVALPLALRLLPACSQSRVGPLRQNRRRPGSESLALRGEIKQGQR